MNEPTAVRVPLTHNPAVLVDVDDLDRVLEAGPWQFILCGGKAYAQRTLPAAGRTTIERLHTFLTGWPLVDHVNGNGLDNRRANLRPATGTQNNANRRRTRLNSSGFKGVSWYRRCSKWRAYIGLHGKAVHLGYFASAEDAARAYDAAAREHFGEFARLNFPQETP